MQMTVSKLESIEAYQKYLKDADDQTRGIIEELMQQDRQAVNRLMDALKRSFK